jgi:hypothetical protein
VLDVAQNRRTLAELTPSDSLQVTDFLAGLVPICTRYTLVDLYDPKIPHFSRYDPPGV